MVQLWKKKEADLMLKEHGNESGSMLPLVRYLSNGEGPDQAMA